MPRNPIIPFLNIFGGRFARAVCVLAVQGVFAAMFAAPAFATDTAPLPATIVLSGGHDSGAAWSNTNGAIDAANTNCSTNSAVLAFETDNLTFYGFNAGTNVIPAGATNIYGQIDLYVTATTNTIVTSIGLDQSYDSDDSWGNNLANSNAVGVGGCSATTHLTFGNLTDSLGWWPGALTPADINTSWMGVYVRFNAVAATATVTVTYITLTWRYTLPDCNTNGTPDATDISSNGFADCNTDTTPDVCQITASLYDCNTNGTLDVCETPHFFVYAPATDGSSNVTTAAPGCEPLAASTNAAVAQKVALDLPTNGDTLVFLGGTFCTDSSSNGWRITQPWLTAIGAGDSTVLCHYTGGSSAIGVVNVNTNGFVIRQVRLSYDAVGSTTHHGIIFNGQTSDGWYGWWDKVNIPAPQLAASSGLSAYNVLCSTNGYVNLFVTDCLAEATTSGLVDVFAIGDGTLNSARWSNVIMLRPKIAGGDSDQASDVLSVDSRANVAVIDPHFHHAGKALIAILPGRGRVWVFGGEFDHDALGAPGTPGPAVTAERIEGYLAADDTWHRPYFHHVASAVQLRAAESTSASVAKGNVVLSDFRIVRDSTRYTGTNGLHIQAVDVRTQNVTIQRGTIEGYQYAKAGDFSGNFDRGIEVFQSGLTVPISVGVDHVWFKNTYIGVFPGDVVGGFWDIQNCIFTMDSGVVDEASHRSPTAIAITAGTAASDVAVNLFNNVFSLHPTGQANAINASGAITQLAVSGHNYFDVTTGGGAVLTNYTAAATDTTNGTTITYDANGFPSAPAGVKTAGKWLADDMGSTNYNASMGFTVLSATTNSASSNSADFDQTTNTVPNLYALQSLIFDSAGANANQRVTITANSNVSTSILHLTWMPSCDSAIVTGAKVIVGPPMRPFYGGGARYGLRVVSGPEFVGSPVDRYLRFSMPVYDASLDDPFARAVAGALMGAAPQMASAGGPILRPAEYRP